MSTKNKRTRASSKNLSSVPSITPGACSVFMDSDKAHEAGLPVYAFTLNHTDDFEKALEWGIDGIFTDYPEMLQHFLERRATRREPFLFPDPIRLAAIEPAT